MMRQPQKVVARRESQQAAGKRFGGLKIPKPRKSSVRGLIEHALKQRRLSS